MRQSTTYIIVTSFLATVLLLFLIKKPEWSSETFGLSHKEGSSDKNPPNVINGMITPDISRLISSQTYYQKLCELDRCVSF